MVYDSQSTLHVAKLLLKAQTEGMEEFFLYDQDIPPGLRIKFTWDWLTGERTKVLLCAHGALIMKWRPKEMTKAGSFYTS